MIFIVNAMIIEQFQSFNFTIYNEDYSILAIFNVEFIQVVVLLILKVFIAVIQGAGNGPEILSGFEFDNGIPYIPLIVTFLIGCS